MSAVARLLKEAESAVNEATSLDQLDVARVKYLGRKGLLTTYLKQLGNISIADRPQIGKEVNDAKRRVLAAIEARQNTLVTDNINARLITDKIDVTLPGRGLSLIHI